MLVEGRPVDAARAEPVADVMRERHRAAGIPPLQKPAQFGRAVGFEKFALVEVAVDDRVVAVGAGVNDSSTWSVPARQLPLPVVVKVKVTEPLEISAAVGA